MPVVKIDDGQVESLRGILAEVIARDITYAELQPVYEALVAYEFGEQHDYLVEGDSSGKCNECGVVLPVTEMCDIGRVGTGYECEPCYDRGIES